MYVGSRYTRLEAPTTFCRSTAEGNEVPCGDDQDNAGGKAQQRSAYALPEVIDVYHFLGRLPVRCISLPCIDAHMPHAPLAPARPYIRIDNLPKRPISTEDPRFTAFDCNAGGAGGSGNGAADAGAIQGCPQGGAAEPGPQRQPVELAAAVCRSKGWEL